MRKVAYVDLVVIVLVHFLRESYHVLPADLGYFVASFRNDLLDEFDIFPDKVLLVCIVFDGELGVYIASLHI
jgi:hypothetical protein